VAKIDEGVQEHHGHERQEAGDAGQSGHGCSLVSLAVRGCILYLTRSGIVETALGLNSAAPITQFGQTLILHRVVEPGDVSGAPSSEGQE
jgi:hypothetical protein